MKVYNADVLKNGNLASVTVFPMIPLQIPIPALAAPSTKFHHCENYALGFASVCGMIRVPGILAGLKERSQSA